MLLKKTILFAFMILGAVASANSATTQDDSYAYAVAPYLRMVTNNNPVQEQVVARQIGWDTQLTALYADLTVSPYEYAVAPYVMMLSNGDDSKEQNFKTQLGY